MKLQKSYGCDVHQKICEYPLHIFVEHKIMRQKVLLETPMRLLSGNWVLTCFKKFQVCLETQH